jgi:hypothetical protein
MLFFYFYLVTGCDERSKLGTFIQVRIKDRMAEIETDDIGELHEKVSVSATFCCLSHARTWISNV